MQKINEPWVEADIKANGLVTPQLAEECKEKVFSTTNAKEQLAPFASNIKITQFIANRWAILLLARESSLYNVFVLSGPFSYMFWGAPKSGRYGCIYLFRGDHLEFVDVVNPSSFKVTTYISM
jgi:hypothetical protein